MTRRTLIAAALGCLYVTAAAPGWAASSADRLADLVILDEAAVKNLGIEVQEVEEGAFEETVFALGRIRVAPGHRAVVSSRVPGRVLSVSAHIDTPVRQGAEVAVLESRQPGDPPPTVRLTAPISGLVSAMHVVPGQPVTPDTALLEIVDLHEIHAVAAVSESAIAQLKPGQKARIRVAAYPEREFPATLAHLGTEAEEAAGTLEAAFHVENPEAVLRPGMRAEFSIIASTRPGAQTVPREAVQGDPGGRFVYVAEFELKNAFVKTPVQLGAQNDRVVEIVRGLLPGDRVVTRGAYALSFAGKGSVSLKEALDAAHGHPHNEDGSEIGKGQGGGRGHGGDHAPGHRHGTLTPMTIFFAATTGLLLVLLVITFARRGPSAVQPGS